MMKLRERLLSKWIACSLISDKKSVQFGIRFSYPLYIIMVLAGILLKNPFILLMSALIAILAIKLPLHPFDYIYNLIAKLLGINKIIGRGSELQVNSIIAIVFNLIAVALIILGFPVNFEILAIVYALCSIFFIGIFLFR